jgi:hypothetical protein
MIIKKISPKNIPSGSGIRKIFIPDLDPGSGSRIQGLKQKRIPDPQHCVSGSD